MNIELTGSNALYTVEQLCFMLLPAVEGTCICHVSRRNSMVFASCHIKTAKLETCGVSRHRLTGNVHTDVNLERRTLARAVYRAALTHLERPPAWGMLSGVRPAKLVRTYLEKGGSLRGAKSFLEREYFVSPEKAELCIEAGKVSADVHKTMSSRAIALYAHIPFCPSRCAYCSFISSAGDAFQRWGDVYLRRLLEELEMLGTVRNELDMHVHSIYVGGGTPAVYTPEELAHFCRVVKSVCRTLPDEFTVEAGRPDAITAEKLAALRTGGVTRICVNPQTMNDTTLRRIGRAHTACDTLRAFQLARNTGFDAINCDLIAGLPDETPLDFQHSLETVMELEPENITVHTLARKRGSKLNELHEAVTSAEAISEMLSFAETSLRMAGYRPYYLYRQKYTGGGFENIGWTKPGYACVYNVSMMEEIGDIFSAGAGAVTKLTSRAFTRFTNPKYPAEYIASEKDFQSRRESLLAYYRGQA